MLRIPVLRSTLQQLKCLRPTCQLPIVRFSSKKPPQVEEVNEQPLSYLNSKAAAWPARHSRTQGTDERLWYESFVVAGSIAVFMLYFCVFREENDVDEELGRSLFDRLPVLEEKQLILVREYNLERGIDIKDIDARLNEIQQKQ